MEREDKNKILASQGIRLVSQEAPLKPKSRLIDPLSASVKVNIQTIPIKTRDDIKVEKEIPEAIPAAPIKAKTGRKKLLKKILIALLFLIIFGGAYLGYKYYGVPNIFVSKNNTPAEVIKKVGKLIELPKNEEPTVMTITDLAPLSGQEFFKYAEVGDKVLIYSVSKKAILYRPDENRIVSTASLKN